VKVAMKRTIAGNLLIIWEPLKGDWACIAAGVSQQGMCFSVGLKAEISYIVAGSNFSDSSSEIQLTKNRVSKRTE